MFTFRNTVLIQRVVPKTNFLYRSTQNQCLLSFSRRYYGGIKHQIPTILTEEQERDKLYIIRNLNKLEQGRKWIEHESFKKTSWMKLRAWLAGAEGPQQTAIFNANIMYKTLGDYINRNQDMFTERLYFNNLLLLFYVH